MFILIVLPFSEVNAGLILSEGFEGSGSIDYYCTSWSSIIGTYSTSTAVGGKIGTYSGTANGNVITFTLDQTTSACPGEFNGTATVTEEMMEFTFEGYDCMGYHSNGQGRAWRQ